MTTGADAVGTRQSFKPRRFMVARLPYTDSEGFPTLYNPWSQQTAPLQVNPFGSGPFIHTQCMYKLPWIPEEFLGLLVFTYSAEFTHSHRVPWDPMGAKLA